MLLYEIVSHATSILPTLPVRERLPAIALHNVADEIFPKYGLTDDDVPHMRRMLFKIGAVRGEETLLQKFEFVMGELGIELDFTDDPLVSSDSADPPSLDVSDHEDALQTPKAPLPDADVLPPRPTTSLAAQQAATNSSSPMHYAPHRRRNSDSIALNFGKSHDDDHKLAPILARAHSAAGMELPSEPPSEPQKKEVRFSDVIDSQSISEITYEQDPSGGTSTIEGIPFRPKSANGSANLHQQGQASADARPSTRAENRAPPDFSSFGQQAQRFPEHQAGLTNGDVLSDEEFSSIMMEDLMGLTSDDQGSEPSLPKHPSAHQEDPGAHAQENSETTDEHADLRHDEYSTQLPARDAQEEQEAEDEGRMQPRHFNFLQSREQMFKMSSFSHWRSVSRFNSRAQAYATKYDRWDLLHAALIPWVEYALTLPRDEYQRHQALQEHMQLSQTRAASDPNAENDNPFATAFSESNAHQRVKQSIERSRFSSQRSASDLRAVERQGRQPSESEGRTPIEDAHHRSSNEPDIADVRAEQLQSLGREWERERLRRSIEEDDLYYDAEEDPEEQEMARETAFQSQYQIAAAAWDYFLVSKAFSHWATRAAEEMQRTEVARRHILRRKCFNAWLLEGQNDETEAESKAVWFSQLNVLKQWRDTAVISARRAEKLQRMAILRDWKATIENTLTTWYRESKFQLAEAIDTHRLRTACLQHWSAESQWLNSAHEEAEGIRRGTMLGRYMRFWNTEAKIQVRAEQGAGPVITRRDEFLRAGLALAWRHEAEEAKAREKVAIRQDIGGLAKHWLYETKLIAWQEEQDAELLDSSTYHWYLEWRLKFCRRVMDQHEKARFFEKWTDATATESARKYHLRHLARDVRHYDSITGFFNASMDALEQLESQAAQATDIAVQRSAPKVVKKWAGQLEHHRRMERWSQLGRFFAVTEDVVPHWQAIRKQEWKKRMHRVYTDYKYRANRDLVRHCLGTWWQATADTISKGWEADDMIVQDDNALVMSVAETWRDKTEYATFSMEVAEEADKEVQLTLWHSLLEGQEESMSDAIEYDFVQVTKAYSDEWALTSVALRGQEHAVQEFQGHKLRRDMRHFFTTWASQTSSFASFGSSRTLLPGESMVMTDNKNSFRMTRRSTRWTATPVPAPRTRNLVDYTPFRTPARPSFRMSTTTPKYRPPSELTFDEVDEDEEELE